MRGAEEGPLGEGGVRGEGGTFGVVVEGVGGWFCFCGGWVLGKRGGMGGI